MESPAAPAPPPTAPTIAFICEMPCIHCAYDLRTILLSDRCPECGKPVAESLNSLVAASASDIARLRAGLMQTFTACAVIPIVAVGIALAAAFSRSRSEGVLYLVGALLAVGGPLLAWLGLYTTTSMAEHLNDPPNATPLAPRRMAAALRALTPAYAVSSVLLYVLLLVAVNGGGSGRSGLYFVVGVAILTGMAWTARNFAACRLLAAFAARSNGKRTRVCFSVLSWCSAGMFCHALLMAALMLALALLIPFVDQNSSWSLVVNAWLATCIGVANAATGAFVLFWSLFWPIALLMLHRRLRTALRLAAGHAGRVTGPLPRAADAHQIDPAVPAVL